MTADDRAAQHLVQALDTAHGGTHSVRADLLPEPTEAEDRVRLAMHREDLVWAWKELTLHRQMSGVAHENGLAAMAAWHEHSARLTRLIAADEDRCAVILRRQHGRVDELAARRGADA